MSARGLLAFAALLAVTACGVQPTGVIDAGEAPSVAGPERTYRPATDATLYFLFEGQLQGVTRQSPQPWSLNEILRDLLRGPNAQEQAEGIVTLLPVTSGAVIISVGETMTVTVPFPVSGLPTIALSQLVCTTVSRPGAPGGKAGINLIGSDGPAGFQKCVP